MSASSAYQQFIDGIVFSGDVREDIQAFFENFTEQETLDHTLCVVKETARITVIWQGYLTAHGI